MSTPPREQPRLPDDDRSARDTQPDLDRTGDPDQGRRISADEAEERIPDPDE